MILLDTSVLIEMFRMKDKTATFFYRLASDNNDFAISILTHYEILRGSNNAQESFWNNLLKNIDILSFDLRASNEAIAIYKFLKKQNKMIDLADLMIAATAIANNLKLATLNLKDFVKIPDLNILK
jgi:tRNA(fMet)-specific endonuclease VapC